MPDISKCKNESCPKKERCYRYTVPPSEFRQAYGSFAPDENGFCLFFWPNEAGDKDEEISNNKKNS